jgi:hypothetical protein
VACSGQRAFDSIHVANVVQSTLVELCSLHWSGAYGDHSFSSREGG